MNPQQAHALQRTDTWMLAVTLALVCIGTVMVASSSVAIADRDMGQPFYFLVQHLGALAIGVAAAVIAVVIPTDVWFRLNWLLLAAAMGLLAAVLIPSVGQTVNGAMRWIQLGPVGVQASEPARLFLLLYLAGYAVRRHTDLASGLAGFAKPMLIVAAACVLLLAEPDFGAAVVLTVTSLGLMFVAGARLRDFSLVATVAGIGLVVLAMSQTYRVERIMTFRNPWEDPFDNGFQLVQSLIAIGRGEWLGVGLGGSVQKLFYLPEAHTDFVFAVLAEELGFVGSTLVIVLFAAVVYRAFVLGRRAMACRLPFAGLVALGIGMLLGLEASISIGVNTGVLPTKGLALPLISYGRSSIVVTMFAIGLLLRIHSEVVVAERRSQRRERSE